MAAMMVNIILPAPASGPSGGYRVQYELANRLAAIGDRPTILHAWSTDRPAWDGSPRWAARLLRSRLSRQRLVPWHRFHPNVRVRFVPWLSPAFLPKADVTILTAYQTAQVLCSPTKRSGPLVQMVYDYEFWAGGDDATRRKIEQARRRNDVYHVAGSTAVRRMLHDMGVRVVATVPPGIDTERLHCRTPPRDRSPTVGFAYRSEVYKGMADLLAALEQVRERWPDVGVCCFGQTDGAVLPSWVESLGYLNDEELPNFYNRCAIFVLPSHYEGWGLPAAEAMACGAAVVTTNSGGTTDFAVSERNALVVEPRRPDALSLAIVRLLEDQDLRYMLASAASAMAAEMTWEAAARATRTILESAVAGNL